MIQNSLTAVLLEWLQVSVKKALIYWFRGILAGLKTIAIDRIGDNIRDAGVIGREDQHPVSHRFQNADRLTFVRIAGKKDKDIGIS